MAIESIANAATVAAADEAVASTVFTSFLSDVMWFAAGFMLLRVLCSLGLVPARFKLLGVSVRAPSRGRSAEASKKEGLKEIRTEATSGSPHGLLAAWDRVKQRTAMPADVLGAVTAALAKKAPERLVAELAGHLQQHKALARAQVLHALMDSAAQAGRPDLAEALSAAATEQLSLAPEPRGCEVLLSGFAATCDEEKVAALLAAQEASADAAQRRRLHSAVVRGRLRAGNVEAAAKQLLEMHELGIQAIPSQVVEIVRVAAGQSQESLARVLALLGSKVPLPEEAADIAKGTRPGAAAATARERKSNLPSRGRAAQSSVNEFQLKQAALEGGPQASRLFRAMVEEGREPSEGLCGTLLARAGEAQNIAFAEEVADYLRHRAMMTLATYKTFMKVYASNGMFDRACDLYAQVVADGVEPDHVMYGCLVKFAVKCGRMELANELFERTSGGDIQNYMWLIRAAGREGNVDRALELLRKLKESRPEGVDMAVYNCALDACVSSGNEARRQEVLDEMRAAGMLNLVSYNTLIKGHCTKGDLAAARRVIGEMEAAGIAPDSASFNCILGAAVASGGSLQSVWDTIEEMDRKRVPLDHYTISIMMKVARKARTPREGFRALAVLDRPGVNVFEDDILVNTVLDACIARRDTDRLGKVLDAYGSSSLRPSVQTYGLLIKAFGLVKQTSRCCDLWAEMVSERGMTPNDITFSCMLDVLVSAGKVQEAVAVFEEWKGRVPPNIVVYATLMKGFATLGDADSAMELYRQMQADGQKMNTVSYTSLIDAQVRAGNMDTADELLRQMDEDGCPPNIITYSAIARGYCSHGNLHKALGTFQDMLNRGLSADVVIFNTLLDGCVRHNSFDLADELLSEMDKYAVSPTSVTLSIVVKLWGRRRNLDKAVGAVHTALREQRFKVDVQVGTCLISACLYNNNLDRAVEVFHEIKRWPGCDGPDSAAYSNLIGPLLRAGRFREAVELAEEAYRLSSRPRSSFRPISKDVLKALCRAMHEDAHSVPPLSEALRAAATAAGAGEAAFCKAPRHPGGSRGGSWRSHC